MKRLIQIAAALLALAITAPAAYAKGQSLEDRVSSCSTLTDNGQYLACVTQIEADCGTIKDVVARECQAEVVALRAENERDVARAKVAELEATGSSSAAGASGLASSAPMSIELPAHRPRELVVHTARPAICSEAPCLEMYGLRSGDRLAFYINGEAASVVASDGRLTTVLADMDGNGQVDAAELVGVDVAYGPSSVWVVVRPNSMTPIRVVELELDGTIPGRVYVPRWEATHQIRRGGRINAYAGI